MEVVKVLIWTLQPDPHCSIRKRGAEDTSRMNTQWLGGGSTFRRTSKVIGWCQLQESLRVRVFFAETFTPGEKTKIYQSLDTVMGGT